MSPVDQLALHLEARRTVNPPPPAFRLPDVFGDGAVGARVAETLDRVRIAEEELAAAQLPPEVRARAFGVLIPTAALRGKTAELYRAHARELLGRLARGEDTSPGTLAECLSACLYTAGDAPLRQEGQALTEWLFAEVFPEQAKAIGCGEARERWAGQVQEDLAALRRRLATRRGC
jgi:hypothetical protein